MKELQVGDQHEIQIWIALIIFGNKTLEIK
jgi:hypothetical protein